MIRVHFGDRVGEGAPGDTLLSVAQAVDLPLEGTCNGQMACATCHLVVDPAWAERLPAATAAEEDMLDFVPNATRTSRLSCQVRLTEALDGLTVRMP
jgi:ferredoxin-2, mitochondrial